MLTLLLCALLGPQEPAAEATPAPRVHRDLPYHSVEGVDPRLLSLDLYAPGRGEGLPVLVMIHGGGWQIGDKGGAAMAEVQAPFFVAEGFVYVSLNYRLAPAVRHPAQVQDVARAIAWVHDHVAKYGGDPGRMALMGHSAGAHLAALVATDDRRLAAHDKSLAILRGVVLLDGAAYDLPRHVDELGAGERMLTMWTRAFGPRGEGEEDPWRDASPRHHVAPDKGIPPFLVVHGALRRGSAKTLSQELAQALTAAGSPSKTLAIAKSHAAINRDLGKRRDRLTLEVDEFLTRYTRPVEDPNPGDAPAPGSRDQVDHHHRQKGPPHRQERLPLAPPTQGAAVGLLLLAQDPEDAQRAPDEEGEQEREQDQAARQVRSSGAGR